MSAAALTCCCGGGPPQPPATSCPPIGSLPSCSSIVIRVDAQFTHVSNPCVTTARWLKVLPLGPVNNEGVFGSSNTMDSCCYTDNCPFGSCGDIQSAANCFANISAGCGPCTWFSNQLPERCWRIELEPQYGFCGNLPMLFVRPRMEGEFCPAGGTYVSVPNPNTATNYQLISATCVVSEGTGPIEHDCGSDPPPPPPGDTGACCHGPEGTQCSDTSELECQQLNGTWFPGVDCTRVNCTTPIGACCYVDPVFGGQCVNTTSAQCALLGGTWYPPPATCQNTQCQFGEGGGSRGFGDTVAKFTSALGVKPCAGCKQRQDWLNRWLPYSKGS